MANPSRLRRFAQTAASWLPVSWIPGVPDWAMPTDPLKADEKQLRDSLAFVDPSRLFAGRLSIPYNPSVLVTRKGLSIFDAMKRDEQIKSALIFKKLAVLASGWEVVSPGGEDDKWEVTVFARDSLTALPGGMLRALQKIMLGIDYGYSLTEKVFADGEGNFAGKLVISKLNSVKPHYFDFQMDGHGKMLTVLQRYVPGQVAQIQLPPEKFVIYTHEPEFENPYGRSDLEAVYRAWWAKDNAYKWLCVLLERYGMPPLFLFYNPDQYQGSQLDQLKNVVKNIQNATMGLLPRNDKAGLEFWKAELAGQGKDVFLAALSKFDSDISKGLLQPSLTGFSDEGGGQQGSRGSLARSNVHWKAFLHVVAALQGELAETINAQLIPQLCDLNYPHLDSYPIFKFGRLDDEAEVLLFNLWLQLVEGKVVDRIPDDEVHIRKALGFPENDNVVVQPLPEKTPEQGGTPPLEIPAGTMSEEMRAFAAANDGEWVKIADQIVCLRRAQA